MKKFMDLDVGVKFKASLNGGAVTEYIKITEERISCCSVLNAMATVGNAQKVQFLPLTEVEEVVNNS